MERRASSRRPSIPRSAILSASDPNKVALRAIKFRRRLEARRSMIRRACAFVKHFTKCLAAVGAVFRVPS
jgi:hypothetical protein